MHQVQPAYRGIAVSVEHFHAERTRKNRPDHRFLICPMRSQNGKGIAVPAVDQGLNRLGIDAG